MKKKFFLCVKQIDKFALHSAFRNLIKINNLFYKENYNNKIK